MSNIYITAVAADIPLYIMWSFAHNMHYMRKLEGEMSEGEVLDFLNEFYAH